MVGPGIKAAGTSVSMGDTETSGGSAICRVRRSYAEVAQQATDQSAKKGADGKQGHPVRQHLEEVASKLAAVAAGRDSHQTVEMQASDGDIEACKAKLAKLVAALRAMPEGDEDFENERTAMAAKIAETKAGMAENKPIGARIDTARKRLTRAKQRAKEASEAWEMAQRVVEESDTEIACIESELHDLEAALAHTPAVPAEIGGQHKRCSQWAVTTTPGPQPGVPGYSSLCTAHRGVSTCLRGSGTATWSSSGPPKEDARKTIPENLSAATAHVDQNEGSEKTSRRIRSRDERRDLGRMKEKSCFVSTHLNTMTVATANVRTLHSKEESESRSRFGGTLMIGKVELLEIAMHNAAMDVVGLQESRSRQAGNVHGPLYRKCCGAADSNGNASCQLWTTAS